MKYLKHSLWLNIVAIIFLILLFTTNTDERVFNAEPTAATIATQADMYSYHRFKGQNENYASEYLSTVPAGQEVSIMEVWSDWYKILLKNGNMGWIESKNVKRTKRTLVTYTSNAWCKLYSTHSNDKDKIVKDFEKPEWIERIDSYVDKRNVNNQVEFEKVKTEDGTTGWIRSYFLDQVGIEQIRFIDRSNWQYNRDSFIDTWKGENIDKFIEEFSEPMAIKIEPENKVYYFSNIYLYKNEDKFIGVKLTVDNGTINEINPIGYTSKWIGYFPFADDLRFPFVINNIGDLFDLSAWKGYDERGENNEEGIDLPDWIQIPLAILFIVSLFAFVYTIMYVPYFISDKIAHQFSLSPKYSNRIVLLFSSILGVVLGYFWFVFSSVSINVFNEWIFFHFFFVLGMTIGYIQMWKSKLMYVRCQRCGQWTGVHDGSELISSSDISRTVTYSSGRRETSSGKEEVWIDFRKCINDGCGNAWSILRRWFSGFYR